MTSTRDGARVYAHVDMDAFYVAVELLRRPELRGKPVIVATGSENRARGVVMTASYEARSYGVHSALPLTIAHRRCPDLIQIPSDRESYLEISREVMSILRGYSERVEIVGIDEAYLDLSDSAVPKSRARQLKVEIRDKTGLVCSVGLAENKLLAKIASDLDKPDGLCLLATGQMLDRVGDRPAKLIPGVGPKTAERLSRMGIGTVAELARADRGALDAALGPSLGALVHDRANGIDPRPLETERRPKSESRETTFAEDVADKAELASTLDRLAGSVCEGLAKAGYSGRTVTMKIRLRPFRTFTRSRTLPSPTRDGRTVAAVARELLERFELDAPVRLIGVGVAGLAPDDEQGGGGAAPGAAEGDPAEPLRLDLGLA
ncbi:MAG TPA: DNA polymerase IV [Solirubrobacterales bacterium]|nr:DNA polymerase IV [Solirubrobacterales bacterium]